MTLALVNETIKKELAAVERLFTEELATDLTCVNNLVRHVSRFRGKMLRPTLVLLAGSLWRTHLCPHRPGHRRRNGPHGHARPRRRPRRGRAPQKRSDHQPPARQRGRCPPRR